MENQDGKVGKYTIVSKIGDGGMAEVFLGHFRGEGDFEKIVAVKKILPNLASNERFRRNFINEARICAKLHHHNIVEVYDFIQEGNNLYLVMEYIDGLTLEDVFAYHREVDQQITTDVIFTIMFQLLEGLDYAHSATDPITKAPLNVIHRDFKPSNILIDDRGIVKIVDFGVAKAAIKRYETQEFTAKGSPSYMAPEQVLDTAEVTQAADVFAAGAIFYELLTLERLFDGPNVFAILKQVSTLDIDAHLEQTIEGADRRFLKILKKALARDVSKRYQKAGEMLQDMNAMLHGVLNRRRLADLLRKIRNLDENVEDAATRLVTDVDAILAQYEIKEGGSAPDPKPAETSAPGRDPASPAVKIVPGKLVGGGDENTLTIQSESPAEDPGTDTVTAAIPSGELPDILESKTEDASIPSTLAAGTMDDGADPVGVDRARVLQEPPLSLLRDAGDDPDRTLKAALAPEPAPERRPQQQATDSSMPSILRSMPSWSEATGTVPNDDTDDEGFPDVDLDDDDDVAPPPSLPVTVGTLHETEPNWLAPILLGASLGIVILLVLAIIWP